jgi:SAM-dependent methyltransferase
VAEPWHPYVFDAERRRFVGDFEGMYRAESQEDFDSWHQSDPRRLDTKVAAMLLEEIAWATAVDLGCGKGAFTATLKRRDNRVVGVDASETAVRIARGHFPDIEFVHATSAEYLERSPNVDLIVARELLSYLENWREQLAACARVTRYLLVGLFVPDDPIGFVKSREELLSELERHFEVLEAVHLERRRITTCLCETRR